MELKRETLDAIAKWANGDNTGRSSLFMAMSAVADVPIEPVYWPKDPADFKRCYIFMEILSPYEQKVLLCDLASRHEKWAAIAKEWHNLRAYYLQECEQDRAPKLYQYMKDLGL